MSYTSTHITTIAQLKMLAEKAEATYAKQTDLESLETTVNGLVATGGEANVIESISVNGTTQTVTDKNVDITVPTAVSELTNDSDYQTGTEVEEAIASAVSASGHASFQTADAVPSADEAEENVLYLVMNSSTGYYDIYALVSGSVVLLDDTSVDLADYVTSSALTAALASYVTSSTLTSTLADYILSSEIATDTEVTEMLAEIYG